MDTKTQNRPKDQVDKQIRIGKTKWSLPFLAVFLPIVLLSIYSFQVASVSIKDLVEAKNLSATSNLSQLLMEDITQTVVLAHAVASVPGTVEAVENHDEVATKTRLKAIVVSNQKISRAIVTDENGIIWNEYPRAAGADGTSLMDNEWFEFSITNKHPSVSHMYIRPEFLGDPAIAITVPIFSDEKEIIGTLIFEYKAREISREWKNAM